MAERNVTSDREDIDRVWKLIEKIDICMFASRDGEKIRARPMSSIPRQVENTVYFLTDVKGRAKRLDLLQQALGQFAARAHRHCRDVVDRLVGVQLDALAADFSERVDHVRPDFEQAELEHLEQSHRTRADDDGVGLDRAGHVDRGVQQAVLGRCSRVHGFVRARAVGIVVAVAARHCTDFEARP